MAKKLVRISEMVGRKVEGLAGSYVQMQKHIRREWMTPDEIKTLKSIEGFKGIIEE